MNYHKIETASIGNGPGFRVVLYISGCIHNCPGCQNPETHDYKSGKPFDDTAIHSLLAALNHPWIAGLTLSGGDPLAPRNIGVTDYVVNLVRQELPEKTIWLYTGNKIEMEDFKFVSKTYEQEDFFTGNSYREHLRNILLDVDVVVDGPYIEAQRNIALAFRGSENQRLIDCKGTIRENQIVELNLDGNC